MQAPRIPWASAAVTAHVVAFLADVFLGLIAADRTALYGGNRVLVKLIIVACLLSSTKPTNANYGFGGSQRLPNCQSKLSVLPLN